MRNFANQLHNSPQQKHLFFLVLTIVAIIVIGYRFGTFDQSFHIPFLKAYSNPLLYRRDPIIDLRWQNYSFFWHSLLPFYELDLRLGFDEPYILETVMFLVHGLSTYLTFWAIWILSETLFENHLTSLVATISFLMPHIGQGFFPVIEFSLLNRTFVLPFVLFSLTLQLRGRTWFALGLLGLLFNLHAITALFGLSLVVGDCALNKRRLDMLQIGVGLLALIILALPVLIWKASGTFMDLSIRKDWYSLVVRSVLANLYRYWGAPYLNAMTLSSLGVYGMFILARRYAPSQVYSRSQDALFFVPLIIILIQSILMSAYPVTFLMELQLMRVGLFALIVAYVSFANLLAVGYEANNTEWQMLCTTLVVSPTPVLAPILWSLQHLLPTWRFRIILTAITIVSVLAMLIAYLYQYKDNLVIGVDIYPAHTYWYQAQRWAHDHTPLDALFITPPQIWSFDESDWRVFSERGTVTTLADTLEIALIPDYQVIWQPRFEAVAPGALDQFQGDYFQNKRITAAAFYGLTFDQLQIIARYYGASYLVVEKPHMRPFFSCYENTQYVVYALNKAAAKEADCILK